MRYLILIMGLLAAVAVRAHAEDTVIIELSDKSKIYIYTDDRESLKEIEQYDLNKMIKDLNTALGSKKIQRIELETVDGKKYKKDTTIIIGESGAKTKIKIGNLELLIDVDEWDDLEDEFDEDMPVTKSEYEEEPEKRTRNYFNIDFGLNNWMEGSGFPDDNNQPYAVKPWGSWFIGLNSVNRTWLSGPLFLDWGLGVNWYNWKMQDADIVITKGEEQVEFNEAPEIQSGIKTKLTTSYVNVTVVPLIDFSKGKRKVKDLERGSIRFKSYKQKGVRFGVGGYVGYRLGGHSKFVYKEDGDKEKDKEFNNFYLNNFRYGIRAQFGFKGLDLFAMYDLNRVFADGRGPAGSEGLNAISFGITL